MQYILLKRRFLQEQHGVTSQKTAFIDLYTMYSGRIHPVCSCWGDGVLSLLLPYVQCLRPDVVLSCCCDRTVTKQFWEGKSRLREKQRQGKWETATCNGSLEFSFDVYIWEGRKEFVACIDHTEVGHTNESALEGDSWGLELWVGSEYWSNSKQIVHELGRKFKRLRYELMIGISWLL
jgi:hypothetical protein